LSFLTALRIFCNTLINKLRKKSEIAKKSFQQNAKKICQIAENEYLYSIKKSRSFFKK